MTWKLASLFPVSTFSKDYSVSGFERQGGVAVEPSKRMMTITEADGRREILDDDI